MADAAVPLPRARAHAVLDTAPGLPTRRGRLDYHLAMHSPKPLSPRALARPPAGVRR